MVNTRTTTFVDTMPLVIERIKAKQEAIHQWLKSHEGSNELPLYSSVDIRDAGFKIAVVDTNIFPAGFNNLCEHGLADSVGFIKKAILGRVPNCRNILIVAEEHTRNTAYLENIRILQEIIKNAGFNVKIATFFTDQPNFCDQNKYAEFKTSTGQTVHIHCFKNVLEQYESGKETFDLIIMNNDLIGGIPEILNRSKVPIYPSIQAGWHSRHKSHHFSHANNLMRDFAKIIDLDPWIFSCLYTVVDNVDINLEDDRKRLLHSAEALFTQIEEKYKKHHLTEKPYFVLKADAGTYGMGVLAVEKPEDILKLNHRARANMSVGKSGSSITRFLIQEGVPTIYSIDEKVSEVVIYQIENNLIGGFYRSHSTKTDRESLNTKGMDFKKMCPHLSKYGDCGVHHDITIFDVYRILARIAAIAARREIIQLEERKK